MVDWEKRAWLLSSPSFRIPNPHADWFPPPRSWGRPFLPRVSWRFIPLPASRHLLPVSLSPLSAGLTAATSASLLLRRPMKVRGSWAMSAQLPNPFSDRAHALAWRATLSILPMREHSSLLFARSDVISLWFYLLIFFNGKRKKKHLLWEKENLLSFKIIKSKNLKNAHNKSFGLRKNILLFLSTRHLRLCLFVFYWSIADLQQFFKEQIIHVYYTSLQRHKGVCREKWGEGKTVSSPETSITSLFTMTKTRLPSMETE